MPRRRLGVAVVVPPPVRHMVDGLRGALGDDRLARVPAHVTLVPPVNVPETSLPMALALLRAAAAAAPSSITVQLGPVASFLPDNPVVVLRADGEPSAMRALKALRDTVFLPPLERPLAWPWVPHVTLLDGADPVRIDAIVELLAGFSAPVAVDVLHLLEEGPDRVWRPIAGERLGSAGVVGRGGLALTISESVMADPEVAAFLELHAPRAARVDPMPVGTVVLVGRRDLEIVGVALRNRRWLESVVVAPEHRHQGIGAHLLARAVDGRARTLAERGAAGTGGAAFLERHGWVPAEHLLVRELAVGPPVDP